MALKGTNQEFGRPFNRRIVLEAIRRLGPIAKGEIAGRVGLTVQTVSSRALPAGAIPPAGSASIPKVPMRSASISHRNACRRH